MTKLGDDFRSWNEIKEEKRRSNLEWSTNYLKKLGISFESKSGGVYLIIDGPDCKIDFWPYTGGWVFRRGGGRGHGIKSLIEKIGEMNAKTSRLSE